MLCLSLLQCSCKFPLKVSLTTAPRYSSSVPLDVLSDACMVWQCPLCDVRHIWRSLITSSNEEESLCLKDMRMPRPANIRTSTNTSQPFPISCNVFFIPFRLPQCSQNSACNRTTNPTNPITPPTSLCNFPAPLFSLAILHIPANP